ncbi:hypothetical protein ACJ73_08489 [Blastomyces percursus]|uniref:Uncharacterized protein n=1 Tax=Blastomyces percursus TaxID=1658174 RepID=A0A1J9QVE5_9EURO|nr:hypothetical protein ACJ73_08489 [Blastomyces percursus]
MASAGSPRDGLRHTVVISSDAEMDERQPPGAKAARKETPHRLQLSNGCAGTQVYKIQAKYFLLAARGAEVVVGGIGIISNP